jgi:hypothetical protein
MNTWVFLTEIEKKLKSRGTTPTGFRQVNISQIVFLFSMWGMFLLMPPVNGILLLAV